MTFARVGSILFFMNLETRITALIDRSAPNARNCLGYAFYQAGFILEEGLIEPRPLAEFDFLEIVPQEKAMFAAAVYAEEQWIAHIGYINPKNRRYVDDRPLFQFPQYRTLEEAMAEYPKQTQQPFLGKDGKQHNGFEIVFLGIKEESSKPPAQTHQRVRRSL